MLTEEPPALRYLYSYLNFVVNYIYTNFSLQIYHLIIYLFIILLFINGHTIYKIILINVTKWYVILRTYVGNLPIEYLRTIGQNPLIDSYLLGK